MKCEEALHVGLFTLRFLYISKILALSSTKCYIKVTLLLGFEGKSHLYAWGNHKFWPLMLLKVLTHMLTLLIFTNEVFR